jgi:hypothetical protein
MTYQCELCGLKYESEMIIDKQHCDFIQCYDCLFSMNFNDKTILNGSMGYNLHQYIEISSKYHALIQEVPCTKLKDNGGCYVCMKLLDIPIENYPNNKNDKINDKINNTDTPDNSISNTDSFLSHNINIYNNNNDIDIDNNFILSL